MSRKRRDCPRRICQTHRSASGASAIVAHQGRQVESNREPGLPLFEQVAETLVGLFSGAEAGEHTHGPQLPAVQGGVYPTRIGVLHPEAQVGQVVEICQAQWGVQPFHRLR